METSKQVIIFIAMSVACVMFFYLGWCLRDTWGDKIKVGTRVFDKSYGGGTVIGKTDYGVQVEFDAKNAELDHRYKSRSNFDIARSFCINFYYTDNIHRLSLIKKMA